jgi:hypothetical protein
MSIGMASQSAYGITDRIGAAFRTACAGNIVAVTAKAARVREYARDTCCLQLSSS